MEQQEIDRLWKLKTEMVAMYNSYKPQSEIIKFASEHIDGNDEQFACMFLECVELVKQNIKDNLEFCKKIQNKIGRMQYSSFRDAARAALFELLIEGIDKT